jgi:short-subunit dehydrogenase
MKHVTYISGATGYAGSMLSDHLASQGLDLLVSARDGAKLQKAVHDLSRKFPTINVYGIPCDLSRPASWDSSSANIKDFQIRNYINCAGIQGQLGAGSEISYEEMERVFNVNLFSSIYFTNLFIKNLKPGKNLSIIHFSGGGSTGPRPMFMPYSLSKTSLLRFVENFSIENKDRDIKINAIAPGIMRSKMQEQVINTPGMLGTVDELLAQKSLASKESQNSKLLALCDFLLSEKSQGITGKLISAEWDNWSEWPNHLTELKSSDLYTLRRITGRDRGQSWGDL